MSTLLGENVDCKKSSGNSCSAVRNRLEPKDKDLGGFSVRRLLPSREQRSVGPFIFFDHLGPALFAPGTGIDVRPHPHIGLATVTYVFAGEVLHRDSLGKVQHIRPSEINWMTAGKGIAHSERTPPGLRKQGHTLHALQLWLALPEEEEQTEPDFSHYGSEDLPLIEESSRSIRVMIGEAYGVKSAVKTFSSTLYVEAQLKAGQSIIVPEHIEERAVYVVTGGVSAKESLIPQHTMAVLDETPGIELVAKEDTTLVIIGGTPLGKRIMWWNLVSTREELMEKAKQDWREGRFPKVPGETEYIPLPE
ncbi:MAG: pirin family protein [Deltaproteobacteria bacterium]|nr:MAG: pirin family protein [Deltaproteobacteria bacterium]